MARNSVLLISVFLFLAFLGCARSDVADTSGTFGVYYPSNVQRYFNTYFRLIRYSGEFTNRLRGIYASVTNRFQIIARNHGNVRTDEGVLEYLSGLRGDYDEFVSGMAEIFSNFNGIINSDTSSQSNTYSEAENNLYLFVRKSIHEKFTDCYPFHNANYTASVLKAQIASDTCYYKYDSVLVKSYTAASAKIAAAETAMNNFGIKLYPCVSALLTDAESLTCVNNVLDQAPDFQLLLDDVYEAIVANSLSEYTACINDNADNKYPSLYIGAVEAYQICIYDAVGPF